MLLEEVIQTMETNKKDMEFLKTGFPTLDGYLDGGFLRKELVILGGHTGVGKSYVAGQFFSFMAEQGFMSSYYSLEISNEMVVSRLIGSKADIKPTRILAGLLDKEEYEKKVQAKADLLCFKDFMHFHDDLYSLEEIKKSVKEEQAEFVVIDFIQNVMLEKADEYERLSRIALELQKLAKDTNSCIMVLSQLSNKAARDGYSAPTIEYRGSGSIAQVCDLGFWLEQEKGNEYSDTVHLYLKKNRRGRSGIMVNLMFRQPGGKLCETSAKNSY